MGVLAESSQQLNRLIELASRSGHKLSKSILAPTAKISSLRLKDLTCVDVWVVCMENHGSVANEILLRLDAAKIPVMFDDAESYGRDLNDEVVKRFSKKIQSCLVDNGERGGNVASSLWVLAASTGGPEAIIDFLSTIPSQLNGAAFLYVQHINEEMLPSLVRSLKNKCKLDVCVVKDSVLLFENTIYVVSPAYKIEVGDMGGVLMTVEPWSGDYTPSANQVMAKVAKVYGRKAGAIVFSGMGDDGTACARLVRRSGSQIWAQSPQTCTIDSMPQCVIDTGCVDFIGSPQELAEKFIHEIVNDSDGGHFPKKTLSQS